MSMSVAELLKKVEALSSSERKKLVRSVLAMDNSPKGKRKKPAERKVKWPDVLARAKRVTGGRILPNLVLLEREEHDF